MTRRDAYFHLAIFIFGMLLIPAVLITNKHAYIGSLICTASFLAFVFKPVEHRPQLN